MNRSNTRSLFPAIVVRIRARVNSSMISFMLRILWSMFTWLPRRLFRYLEYVTEFFVRTAKTTIHIAVYTTFSTVSVLLIASFIYGSFYRLYIPVAEISRPVYFSFSVCSSGHGLCSFPSANVSFETNDGSLQEFLGTGQHYTVQLELELPDTPNNRDLGMFQVFIQMYDRNGVITRESKRSLMMRYQPLATKVISQVLLWPLWLLGLRDEGAQSISVELFPHFVDSYYHPSVGAHIEVQDRHVHIYSAKLKFVAGFTGLKYESLSIIF